MCCDVCVCCLYSVIECVWCFFFSSRRRHTSCALVTGVQTCALPISITGVILSKYVILSALHQVGDKERIQMDRSALEQIQQAELSAVMQAYVGLAMLLIVVWLLIKVVRMPQDTDTDRSDVWAAFGRIAKNRNYVFGVIAQFFYVGARSEEHTSELQSLMSNSYSV